MTHREKQWLLTIQMLQLNTGTPYFDDYYYTVFKERKKKNRQEEAAAQERRYQQQRRDQRGGNGERQETTLTPRVYTPLQFENSLGKLQVNFIFFNIFLSVRL